MLALIHFQKGRRICEPKSSFFFDSYCELFRYVPYIYKAMYHLANIYLPPMVNHWNYYGWGDIFSSSKSSPISSFSITSLGWVWERSGVDLDEVILCCGSAILCCDSLVICCDSAIVWCDSPTLCCDLQGLCDQYSLCIAYAEQIKYVWMKTLKEEGKSEMLALISF